MGVEVRKVAQEDAAVVAGFVCTLLQELSESDDIDREAVSATAEALLQRGQITAFVAT